jgi:E3 ubiquitin-protein ligase SspH2
LKVLHCSNNALTELPPLPPTLEELKCSYNELTSLPPLPSTLKILHCTNNPIYYPPRDVIDRGLEYTRQWMSDNPLSFTKSADKV